MSELTTQLPERLNNTEETGLDAVLSIPLLRLIVEGGPVTVCLLYTSPSPRD